MYLLPFAAALMITACTSDSTGPGDDESPGVDEFLHMTVDGNYWEVENDSTCGAVVANFGSGPIISVAATRGSDSTFIQMNIPWFTGADTLINMPPVIPMTFTYNGVYTGLSGAISISRSTVNSMEVYDGTFNILMEDPIADDTITITNGAFKTARLL